MTITLALLIMTGFMAIAVLFFFLANFAIDAWFDIQSCKMKIEHLKLEIKNLPCQRQ